MQMPISLARARNFVPRAAMLGLVALLCLALSACAAGPEGAVRVTETVDGDTIRAVVAGREESIRLIGVDTAELRPTIEPFGAEARDYVARAVEGEWVWLEFDRNERDRHGRLLAYVWLVRPQAGTPEQQRTHLLNARLLLAGMAEVMTIAPNDKYAALFRLMEGEARQAQRGQWQGVVPPALPSGALSITDLDLSEETVTLTNGGSAVVDLSGWVLVSEVGNQRFSVPAGTALAPGASLTVVSGPRAVVARERLLWTNSRIWNDAGDTAVLLDAAGREVARLAAPR